MSKDRIDLNARLKIERLGARGEGVARIEGVASEADKLSKVRSLILGDSRIELINIGQIVIYHGHIAIKAVRICACWQHKILKTVAPIPTNAYRHI